MNKSQLVESIQKGYTVFRALLAEFDDDSMTQPGVIGTWSVKDIVAHIVVHEQHMLQWITERLHGELPALPQPYAMPEDELHKLNEQIYQENRNRSLDHILRDFDTTHAEVLALVKTTTGEEIFDVSRFKLLRGEALWEAIAANTFWHYEEHRQDINAWRVPAHNQYMGTS